MYIVYTIYRTDLSLKKLALPHGKHGRILKGINLSVDLICGAIAGNPNEAAFF